METENRKADKKKAKEPKLAQNIMNCEAKTFIGKRTHIVTKDGATGAQARAFMNKLESDGTMEQLKAFAAEEKNYIAGICTNFTSKGYDYWVAVEVEPDMERPEGFEMTETPEGSYAYFECEGGSEEAIAKKWEEVYNKWFPKSGYNHKGTQEIEVYPAGDMEAEGYRCTLLVPVRPLEKIPLSKYRRNSLGSAPFILLGSVVGLLIAGNKATDTKTMLIAALIGGALAWFVYDYVMKRRRQREEEKEQDSDR